MKILTDTGLVAFWNKIKQLVLGNRPYEPTEFSGKGYKVLEKNIQTVGDVKNNILTAVMLSEANTIYEIRYDFDLGGETIEMKEGCTLKFEGGSLSNGTLEGSDTDIIVSHCNTIFKNIVISGFFKSLNPLYFDEENEKVAMYCINNTRNNKIDFYGKTIYPKDTIVINRSIVLVKNLNIQLNEDIFRVLHINNQDNVSFENLYINCNSKAVRCVTFENSQKSNIRNSTILNLGNLNKEVVAGIEFKGDCSRSLVDFVFIDNVKARNNSSGIVISKSENTNGNMLFSTNIVVQNSYISNVNAEEDADGIKVLEMTDELGTIAHTSYHKFENLHFENCDKRALKLQTDCPVVKNIYCQNGKFGQSLVDFMGEYNTLDGLYATGLSLNTGTYNIFLSHSVKTSVKNVVIKDSIKENDINATLINDQSNVSGTIILENIEVDTNMLIRSLNNKEIVKNLILNNVTHKLGYHYSMDITYYSVIMNNFILDTSSLDKSYWVREFNTVPSVIISNLDVNMLNKDCIHNYPQNNYVCNYYYTSTKKTLKSIIHNGHIETTFDDWAGYPSHLDYTKEYSEGDTLVSPIGVITMIKGKSESNPKGLWMLTEPRGKLTLDNISVLTNNPSVYDISNIRIILDSNKTIHYSNGKWYYDDGNLYSDN